MQRNFYYVSGHTIYCIKDRAVVVVVTKSCLTLFVTPWTVAHQAPLSRGFSGQEYWSGLPFPFPGNLPDPGIKPVSPELQVDSSLFEPPGTLCNTKNYSPKVKQHRI